MLIMDARILYSMRFFLMRRLIMIPIFGIMVEVRKNKKWILKRVS
jgi:hypothetical protein